MKLNAETVCCDDVTGGQTGEADRQVTHSEGEVRSQRGRVEIFKDGVLEVRKLQTCRDENRTDRLTSHLDSPGL